MFSNKSSRGEAATSPRLKGRYHRRAKGRGDRKDLIIDVVLGIGFLCSIIVGAVKTADVMYVAF
jgi:hypothetical protein